MVREGKGWLLCAMDPEAGLEDKLEELQAEAPHCRRWRECASGLECSLARNR